MTPRFHFLATLTALCLAGLIFWAGFLCNGYVQRGELLAAYNGANQMRQDARADTLALQRALMLPDSTPGPLSTPDSLTSNP